MAGDVKEISGLLPSSDIDAQMLDYDNYWGDEIEGWMNIEHSTPQVPDVSGHAGFRVAQHRTSN